MAEHPTTLYAQRVREGELLVCEWERLACERHLNDLERERDEAFPFVFDESRADRIFDWFEQCCYHVRGPFAGERIGLMEWQKFDLGCKYGWVHEKTGRRRFRKAFNERARGNVKSTEMSGIALYGMCSDCVYPPGKPYLRSYELQPEVECAAVDKDQAKRVWMDARAMGEKSPDIAKRMRIKRTYVEHSERGGFMRPLSKDTKNKDGGAPCIVIIDEYHAHPTSEIHDVLFSGFGKRAQSLMEIITTAGNDAENNPCRKEEEYAKGVLRGEIGDETYFAMVRALDKGDDPHNEAMWVKANPILQNENEYSAGLLEQIRVEHNSAYDSRDPSKVREFLTKRCDLWQYSDENRYMDGCMDIWKELAVTREEFARLTEEAPEYDGLDLSKTIDLTARAKVYPLSDGRFAISAIGYMPEEGANRHEKTDRIPYMQYAKEGWCKITEGAVTDYHIVREDILADNSKKRIEEICYDQYNATHLSQELQQDGFTVVEVNQGIKSMSEATKRFRELVLQRRIVHDGSPLLTWCVSNAVEINDNNGNIRISKKNKDDTQRVDLLAAVLTACVRAFTLKASQELRFFIG